VRIVSGQPACSRQSDPALGQSALMRNIGLFDSMDRLKANLRGKPGEVRAGDHFGSHGALDADPVGRR
jgi:hypothetical protein